MPNGRTGGFRLKRFELEQLLYSCNPDVELGRTLKKPMTGSQLRRVVDKWKEDDVVDEEQDHSWYILHFKEWITVGSDSPLFEGLRRHHAEWHREAAEKRRKA